MRKPLHILPVFLPGLFLLCGFTVPPFEATAVPRANDMRKQALVACNARKDYKSTAEVIDCVVTADRDFARAVHLTDSRPLDSYAAAVKALDNDIAAGTVKPDAVGPSFRVLQAAFFKAINNLYADYESKMAQDFVAQSNDQNNAMHSGGMNSMDNMGNMGMGGM